MGKYLDIIDSPWIEMTLYPESIPHLLHHDLAYLWVLEKESHLRPKIWEERLEAWRCLVELLLIGELDVKEETIKEPLIKYTRPHGITSVSWTVLRNTDEFIGALSPVVLLRPLPDFSSEDLAKLRRWRLERRRPSEFPFYLQLAIRELREGQPENSFRARLAIILEKEFAQRQTNNPPHNAFGARISVPMLGQFVWGRRLATTPVIDHVDILVKRGGNGDHTYVPRCKTCSFILTKARTSAPVSVDGDSFRIDCENPSGSHVNQLDVPDFLIWNQAGNKVVVWDQEGATAVPEKGFPPKPFIQGIQVDFEWNEAQLGGEREKRFLTLQFTEKELFHRKLKDIFFQRILVGGSFEKFKGLPIRPEWIDALSNPHQVAVEADPADSKVTYREIRIKGWPMSMIWVFKGHLGVKEEPKLGVGIYPDPHNMPEHWHWYRCFLNGPARRTYRLRADSCKPMLPWLVETENARPKSLSITDDSGEIGATYHIGEVMSRFGDALRADVYLGIDFGTTSSAIYYLPPGENAENPRPDRYGLKPSLLSTNVKWFAETEGGPSESIGDFLPGLRYREDLTDAYIMPSALWQTHDQFLVRWGPEEPVSSAQPLDGFKWDKQGKDNYAHRRAYLRELLLLSLPLIIKNLALNTSKAKFHLGFAFPLAFDFDARRRMQALLGEIESILHEATGFDFESYSINESTACVRAFGTFNPGETFLVADMGGGTMDLSFFTVRGTQLNDIHQIGSIQFAGETYVEALTRRKRPNVQEQDTFHWKLKDSINSAASQDEYGRDQAAQTTLHRFGGLAFEFLRTQVAAFRQDAPEQEIHLVLVGNGWHLAEAFSAETRTRGAKRVFREHYSHPMNQLDEVSLDLYFGEPLPSLPSSKHLIVIGALRNVSGPQKRKELGEEPNLSKLPAGREFQFNTTRGRVKKIDWYELVGEAFALTEYSVDELTRGKSDYTLLDVPALREPWRSYLLGIFGVTDESKIPYPDIPNLRDKVLASIQGHPPKITKGPLQIILEQRWADWLTED